MKQLKVVNTMDDGSVIRVFLNIMILVLVTLNIMSLYEYI